MLLLESHVWKNETWGTRLVVCVAALLGRRSTLVSDVGWSGGVGLLAGGPEVVDGLHVHPHLGGGAEYLLQFEGHLRGDAGAAVQQAGEGGAVNAQAGCEACDFSVAHIFLQDLSGVGRVVHLHRRLLVVVHVIYLGHICAFEGEDQPPVSVYRD